MSNNSLGGAGKWEHILEIFKQIFKLPVSKYLSFYRGKYNICKKILKNKINIRI